jgi:NAD-dependent DNA ligase
MNEQLLNRLNNDRLESRQVDELIGLARGIIADGEVSESEVTFLEKWLVGNLSISNHPMILLLYQRIGAILVDGVADGEERADLLATLESFTASDIELGEALKSSSLPLCSPAPVITFSGRSFCFTGTFSFGQRRECALAVEQRGGTSGSLTKSTNVLVIGCYATESWKHSSFGTKIMKAAEMRSKGVPISIVSEVHWKAHL